MGTVELVLALAGWYLLVVLLWKSVGDRLIGEAESGVWVARAGI